MKSWIPQERCWEDSDAVSLATSAPELLTRKRGHGRKRERRPQPAKMSKDSLRFVPTAPLRDHRNMAKTSIIESACAVLVLPLDVGTFAGLRLHTSKTLTFTYPLRKKPFPTVPVWAEEMK